jgi:cytoplasmic tRNA 2-thiolation protein 1
VFRRQALDRGAEGLGVGHIVTGHNADDIAETVLMNSESTVLFSCLFLLCLISSFLLSFFLLAHAEPFQRLAIVIVMRGDIARLARCTSLVTESEDTIKRSKPFKYAYEKEIVMSVSLS